MLLLIKQRMGMHLYCLSESVNKQEKGSKTQFRKNLIELLIYQPCTYTP